MFPSMANKYQFHKLTWCKRHYLHAIGGANCNNSENHLKFLPVSNGLSWDVNGSHWEHKCWRDDCSSEGFTPGNLAAIQMFWKTATGGSSSTDPPLMTVLCPYVQTYTAFFTVSKRAVSIYIDRPPCRNMTPNYAIQTACCSAADFTSSSGRSSLNFLKADRVNQIWEITFFASSSS